MTNQIIEAALLLGLPYIEKNLDCALDSEIFAEALNECDSPCLDGLQSLLRSLLDTSDLYYISKTLSLSPFFLLLLKQDSCNSGYCLMCDAYYQNLEIHFNLYHKLSREVYQKYRNQFFFSVEAFFPFKSAQKKQKIKAPVYCSNPRSKTLKFHWQKNAKYAAKTTPSKNTEETASVPKNCTIESLVVSDLSEQGKYSVVILDSMENETSTPKNPNGFEFSKPSNTLQPVTESEKILEPLPVVIKLDPSSEQPSEKLKKNSKNKKSEGNNQEEILEVQEILEISTNTTGKSKKRQVSSETFICDYCFKSISVSIKKSHIYCHKRNETVQCPDCGDSFKYRNQKHHKEKCLSRGTLSILK